MAALQPDLIGPPGVRLRGRAGPPARRGRGGPLRDPPRLGRAGPSTATASSSASRSRWRRRRSASISASSASALRVPVAVADGGRSWRSSSPTSTTSRPTRPSARPRPASSSPGWTTRPAAGGTIVVGDFNAEPVEPAYRVMAEAGFRSASVEANGAEPAVTWPSGIQAPGMDTDGDPGCLDYIWLRGPLRAVTCRLAFDRPAADDPDPLPVRPPRPRGPRGDRGVTGE